MEVLVTSASLVFTGSGGLTGASSVLASLPTFSVHPSLAHPVISSASSVQTAFSLPLAPCTPALPPKLIKKILELDFVDMTELVPDTWQFQDQEESGKCCSKKLTRRGPVTDITLWIECYSILVAVLASKYPERTPAFMAYLRTILKAQRSFHGEGWVSYDLAYRRRAAYTKSLEWDKVDFTLFNETFAGRAKVVSRCRFCLSEFHISADCQFASAVGSPKREFVQAKARKPFNGDTRSVVYLCNLFNNRMGNQCRYKQCKFAHLCANCYGMHALSECTKDKGPLAKRARPS